jgi:NADH-quinone oxidoreductase subunit J
MIDTVLLYLFCASALAGAVLMLLLHHPMRVALALVGSMISLAGIYAVLQVHVIAVFQVLIYVGAVMVFMVYAIMLLDVREGAYARRYSRLAVPGVAAVLALLGVVAHGIWRALPDPTTEPVESAFRLKEFAVAFLNDYWLHFELVSVLLIAAIVAALAVLDVGRRDRG